MSCGCFRSRSNRWLIMVRACGAARSTSTWNEASPDSRACSAPRRSWLPRSKVGRSPRDRQLLSPWGERRLYPAQPQLPWPGCIPPPAPARVFATPDAVGRAERGPQAGEITDRGLVSAAPAFVSIGEESELVPIDAWAGPWPIDELWWDPDQARQVARFQVAGLNGSAWLLIIENDQWWTEARYD